MENISRRTFFKLAGTASITAIFGAALYGCDNEEKSNTPIQTEDKKYYEAGQHHFYIEISTETNGETEYHEETITQTQGFVTNPNVIQVKGGRAGGARGGSRSGSRSRSINRSNPSKKNDSSENNSSKNNSYPSQRYYGRSNGSTSNDFTLGLLLGTIVIGSTTLFYGNTDAEDSETMNIDIPEGYEITNTEELKNEDTIYGYKIHMENTAPVEVTGYSDENGNITYPYPGSIAKTQTQTANYVKKISKEPHFI